MKVPLYGLSSRALTENPDDTSRRRTGCAFSFLMVAASHGDTDDQRGSTSTFHHDSARETCSRLAIEGELSPRNSTIPCPVMTPEPNSAEIVPAPANSQASGERGGALTRVVMLVLLLSLLCWNLLLLGILFTSMPKNDFG